MDEPQIKAKSSTDSNPTLVYEVNLMIDKDIVSDYLAWLQPHIDELLEIPGFRSANLFQIPDNFTDDRAAYSCQYWLDDQTALQSYYKNHAPRMRDDGLKRFPDKFTASRRVLKLFKRF